MATWAEATMVVPLDGRDESARAVPVAGRISRRLGSELHLVRVVSDPAMAEDARSWVEETAAGHLDDGHFSIAVAVGDDVSATIAAEASTDGLVCMATAGSVRFHDGHWGSVAEGVARVLGRPMLMVGPNADPEPGEATQRVIAPLDGSVLAEASLRPAMDLATVLGVPLWLIAVVSPIAQASEAISHSGAVAEPEEAYLARVAGQLTAPDELEVHVEVLQSENIDRSIVEFAGEDGTVVISTHGRSGLQRLFAGSVAAGVVAHSRRAVAVIRATDS